MASTVYGQHTSAVKLVAVQTWILCAAMQSIVTVSPFLYSRRLSWNIKHSPEDVNCWPLRYIWQSVGFRQRTDQQLSQVYSGRSTLSKYYYQVVCGWQTLGSLLEAGGASFVNFETIEDFGVYIALHA